MKRALCAIAFLGTGRSAGGEGPRPGEGIPGESIVKAATIEAINHQTRELTINGPDGHYLTFTAPPEVERFDALTVGDTITARYCDNVVVRLTKPGE